MGVWTQELMELLGILMAWLEVMFMLNVITVMNTSPMPNAHEDWLPMFAGPWETVEGLLFPSAMLEAYERARGILEGLLPF